MMVLRETTKVPFDAYFLLTVTWKGGFTHHVPCRGFNLKSQLKFTESLEYVEKYEYIECTKEDYDLRVWGDGSDFEEKPSGRASKNKTQQKTPAKRKPRAKGNEDSEGARNPSGKSTRATQKKPSVVRKPKVSDVRKPKKDVQGTDSPRKKTAAKPGRSKRSTQ